MTRDAILVCADACEQIMHRAGTSIRALLEATDGDQPDDLSETRYRVQVLCDDLEKYVREITSGKRLRYWIFETGDRGHDGSQYFEERT